MSEGCEFASGARVRVRNDWPETRGPCHIRTPHYVRGLTGTVVRRLGAFPNPEKLAFAQPAEERPLYHVEFKQKPVWGDGRQGDTLLLELYGYWLEEAV